MKILAVDPGFGRCGVAVLEGGSTKAEVVFSMCVETLGDIGFEKRLLLVVDKIEELIVCYSPELFVIESLFFSNNTKTALQVAEVRGALLYMAAKKNVPICEMHPGAAKVALTGYGKATKAQMMFMVEKLTALPKRKRLDDEFDAIALGLAAFAENAHRNTLKMNGI